MLSRSGGTHCCTDTEASLVGGVMDTQASLVGGVRKRVVGVSCSGEGRAGEEVLEPCQLSLGDWWQS